MRAAAHTWGGIIGYEVEEAVKDRLQEIADRHGLYLDRQHNPRAARENNTSVKWADPKGNLHQLDYVLERGGSDRAFGTPVAFIESAWRRGTRHSKNKAQELGGAAPEVAKRFASPFLGVVLAGDWTTPAIQQLGSIEFVVAHIPTAAIFAAFASAGIDAAFADDTPDDEVEATITKWRQLADDRRAAIRDAIADHEAVNELVVRLEASLTRRVTDATVTHVVRKTHRVSGLRSDLALEEAGSSEGDELRVRFSDGSTLTREFANLAELRAYLDILSE